MAWFRALLLILLFLTLLVLGGVAGADPHSLTWTPATKDTLGNPLPLPTYTQVQTSNCQGRIYAQFLYPNSAPQPQFIEMPGLLACECLMARTHVPSMAKPYSAWTKPIEVCEQSGGCHAAP
jgi:hypothetical protein